ncbi:hypothetical protein [Absidia glauca]|uniref:Uncharacterized protein n=1 Tax=Absidia glauca TaxID=4829 RepID=A0A168R799_ABSGL|nr:hypothetical protein [Absidia glauca]
MVNEIPMRSQASYREENFARRQAGGLFTEMESFFGPEFWGLDEMHLLGHGQSKLLYGMLEQKYNHVGCVVELAPFKLINGATLPKIGAAMERSRPFIPSDFSENWSDIHKHHGNYRAVDWYDFLLYVIPTLVTPNLNEASAFALNSLVQGLTIAASWAVRPQELPLMSALFQAWHVFLKYQVDQQTLAIRVFPVTQHYIGHIEYIVKKMGPLPAISCRSLERSIGSYTRNNPVYISNLVETTTLVNHIRSTINSSTTKIMPTVLVDLDAGVDW